MKRATKNLRCNLAPATPVRRFAQRVALGGSG
jgi:hypothetical protein